MRFIHFSSAAVCLFVLACPLLADHYLYVAAERDRQSTLLMLINPDTGRWLVVGDLGHDIDGLAYDPKRDVLYGFGRPLPIVRNFFFLYEINRFSGAATAIGSLGDMHDVGQHFHGYGLAYDSIGDELLFTTRDSLYSLDRSTVEPTLIGGFGAAERTDRGLTFDPTSDMLFLSTEGVLNNVDINGLNTVDKRSGDLAFIGTYKGSRYGRFNNLRAIEFDVPNNRLLGINCGRPCEMVEIDRATGLANVIFLLPKAGDNMAFVTTPLPVDTNDDSSIDDIDLNRLLTHFGQSWLTGGRHMGDFDLDGSVGDPDLNALLLYFAIPIATTHHNGGGASDAAIPEPTCLMLLATVGTIAGIRRRMRRAA